MTREQITADFNDDLRTTDWLNPKDPAAIILDEREDGKKTNRIVFSGYGAVTNERWCELEQKRIGADKVRIVQDCAGRLALVRVRQQEQ